MIFAFAYTSFAVESIHWFVPIISLPITVIFLSWILEPEDDEMNLILFTSAVTIIFLSLVAIVVALLRGEFLGVG
jgi:hypothetical protein